MEGRRALQGHTLSFVSLVLFIPTVLQIAVNYLQVTAVAIAVDTQWTFAMVALFQTAGE